MPLLTIGHPIVLSDVLCVLPTQHRTATGKPFYHLASISTGLREFVAYVDIQAWKVWIEEFDQTTYGLKHIEDDQLFADLRDFLYEEKLLEIGSRKIVPISEDIARRLGMSNRPKVIEF